MATTNDTHDLLSRGVALARALAAAPDVPANAPIAFPDVLLVAAVEPSPGDGFDLTDADWAELGATAYQSAAEPYLDTGDRLTLDQLIKRQIEFYESWRNDAGKMFALHMTELLIKYRGAGSAPTPAEAMARIEVMEQDVRHDWEARGYEEGKAAGRREGSGYSGPLD
jgi:hypothetical protein